MFKYKFNEHYNPKTKKYDESVIGYNKTVIKFQINYFIKEQYEKNLTEVTIMKNNDGLSGVDKMAMNLDKYDEGATIISDINIYTTIRRVLEMHDFEITEDEVNYYMDHLVVNNLQMEYIHSFYAGYFGNQQDLTLLGKRNYVILMLIMKKIMLLDFGYNMDNQDDVAMAVFPYILTGNLEDRIVNHMIRDAKLSAYLDNSYKYQRLVEDEYEYAQQIEGKENLIKQKLSTITNTRFTYVTYEAPELTGVTIEYDKYQIADEYLSFYDYIGMH